MIPKTILVTRVGDDLLLRIIGTDDSLTLVNQMVPGARRINSLLFDGGTLWNAATLDAAIITEDEAQALLEPSGSSATPFADPIFGGQGSGTPTPGGAPVQSSPDLGAEVIAATGAVDTYRLFVPILPDAAGWPVITGFTPGDAGDVLDIRLGLGLDGTLVALAQGSDTVVYFSPSDAPGLPGLRPIAQLQGIAPTTLTLANLGGAAFEIATNATISGTTGEDITITGGWGNAASMPARATILSTEAGNNHLRGQAGDDIYRWGKGSGNDIVDDNFSGGNDRVEFTGDLRPHRCSHRDRAAIR